ncbi:MAG TPA: WecB/TagA/CpsF family glycosyltransferase [Patescibacteria group bacterium]|nr:WecB/TagA/CpsF family glycosyltransferase [Patescibacteria group bacterium]
MLSSIKLLGVKITTASEEEILEYIEKKLSERSKTGTKNLPGDRQVVIFTPNPEQIVAAQFDNSLKSLLNSADIALPDGVGVVVGARLLGLPIRRRIAGVDFMKSLTQHLQKHDLSISKRPVVTGLIGSQEGVAVEAGKRLQKISPKMTIGYASDVYDREKMSASGVDILYVGLGFPKQEKWIESHKSEVPATVLMAVGGSFDFLSERVVRAPAFLRKIGLEWLFRLVRQPWRIFRQLRLAVFGALIFWTWLGNRLKSPEN